MWCWSTSEYQETLLARDTAARTKKPGDQGWPAFGTWVRICASDFITIPSQAYHDPFSSTTPPNTFTVFRSVFFCGDYSRRIKTSVHRIIKYSLPGRSIIHSALNTNIWYVFVISHIMKYEESSYNYLAIINNYEINCLKGFPNVKRVKLLI